MHWMKESSSPFELKYIIVIFIKDLWKMFNKSSLKIYQVYGEQGHMRKLCCITDAYVLLWVMS